MVLRVPNQLPQVAASIRAAGSKLESLHTLPRNMSMKASNTGVEMGLESVEDTWGVAIAALGKKVVAFAGRVDEAAREYDRYDKSFG